jgi:DNA-directed RNA polymerase sigma subunit (sigma70/sigma32)
MSTFRSAEEPEGVGRTFGITRERIRQIETSTLKTLASLPEAQRLHDCV